VFFEFSFYLHQFFVLFLNIAIFQNVMFVMANLVEIAELTLRNMTNTKHWRTDRDLNIIFGQNYNQSLQTFIFVMF